MSVVCGRFGLNLVAVAARQSKPPWPHGTRNLRHGVGDGEAGGNLRHGFGKSDLKSNN